jgi:hypothetical protein
VPTIGSAISPTPYSFFFTVSAEELNVYTAPGENYDSLGVVRRGDRLLTTGQLTDGSWWRVDFFGLPGWIAAQPIGNELNATALLVVTASDWPTVTPMSPTRTPTSTATATPACPILPGDQFANVWREELTRTRLGCPIEQARTTGSARARFEYGLMYWREDQRMIYVLYNDEHWQEFVDTWAEGESASAGYTPPTGLLEPIRGFGKVWREQLGGPEAAIGWAVEDEIGGDTTVQEFERGVILEIDATIYLLYRDGMRWQYYSPGIGVPAYPMPTSLFLVFVRGFLDNADIWLIDADGSNLRLLIGGSGDQSEPDWSPDGQRIVYQSNQAGNHDVWVIDGDGRSPQPLTTASEDEREPDWSPDRQQIVYRRGGERNGDGELWLMDADGSNQRPLGERKVMGRAPVWSPDGRLVAFMSERDGTWDIYLFDLDSGEVRQLTECSAHCRFPAWSLDGQGVAYNLTESADSFDPIQVWLMRADGSGTAQLLIEGENPGRPAWSVEGLIAFNTSDAIEIINADGSGRHKLPGSDDGWAPDWSH